MFRAGPVGLLAGNEGAFVVVVGAVAVAVSLFLFVGGLLGIASNFNVYRRSARIRNTPVERIDSLSIGRTALHGTVREADETLPQPFANGDCVYVEWEIESKTNSDDGSNWGLVERDAAGVPFELDDGTGRVHVTDPLAAFDGQFEGQFPFLLSEDRETEWIVGSGDEVPPPVREFCEERDIDVYGDSTRRYTQTVIDVDSSVYVFGEARRREGDDPAVELRPEETTGDFIISDVPPNDLASEMRRYVLKSLPIMLVLSTLGLVFLWLLIRDNLDAVLAAI